MAKLTIEDLKRIKEETAKSTSLRDGDANVKITVHMGTCGIAAGARAGYERADGGDGRSRPPGHPGGHIRLHGNVQQRAQRNG